VVNEDLDQRTLLRKYERELRKLRAELQRRSKELVDKRRLLEVRVGVGDAWVSWLWVPVVGSRLIRGNEGGCLSRCSNSTVLRSSSTMTLNTPQAPRHPKKKANPKKQQADPKTNEQTKTEQVEEQKRQAENEKLEVLKVLEARSREFMREKVRLGRGSRAAACSFGLCNGFGSGCER